MLYKWSKDLQSALYQDGLVLRVAIFVNEQNVPEAMEVDEYEPLCHYVTGYAGENALVTARLLPLSNQIYKIQRVAVVKSLRGKGAGLALMLEIERYAKDLGATQLVLGAQVDAIGFYEKLGYVVTSEEYADAGIMHRDMKKDI